VTLKIDVDVEQRSSHIHDRETLTQNKTIRAKDDKYSLQGRHFSLDCCFPFFFPVTQLPFIRGNFTYVFSLYYNDQRNVRYRKVSV